MDAAAQEARRREAWRKEVVNTLERRLFYTPSFEIYGGVAGLYDYGPLGCDIETNVLAFRRQKLTITPNKKELALAFKLQAMGENEAMELKATLEEKSEAEFRVCSLDKVVTIKQNMVHD